MDEKAVSRSSKRRSTPIPETVPTYERVGRPSIPEQMQRELWAVAAGRCQFHGCNEILYIDPISGKKGNLSTIAHIVAYSPKGPRGDEKRSKELEKDISNLMLTCKKHGQLIDNLDYVEQFSEAILQSYKRNHEDRVCRATEAISDCKTNLLMLQARVAGQKVILNKEEAQQAVLPRWPGSEECELIDLNDFPLDTLSIASWEPAAIRIKESVDSILRRRPGELIPEHWSVFAIAPIPLLVFLGRELTSRLTLDLFQHHRKRSARRWCWEDGIHTADQGFTVLTPDNPVPSADVTILVSVTSRVKANEVDAAMTAPFHSYEILCNERSTDIIQYRTQLTEFGAKFRHLLNEIRENVDGVERLHLFLACPAPIAIEVGRSFIENATPNLYIYEYRQPNYFPVLMVEKRGKK